MQPTINSRASIFNILASLVLILSFQTQSLNAQDYVVKIEGHEDTSSWALHESGRIFATVESTNSVIEYDLTGEERRKFDVEAEPTEMIVKGNRLIVACSKDSCLSVIDLDSNQVTEKITLSGNGPYGLFCSKVDNGLVYGVTDTSGNAEVFQANVNTLKVLNRVKTQQWKNKNPTSIEMSANGKWVIADQRRTASSRDAQLMSVDETECTFTDKERFYMDGQVQAGPANQFWTIGSKLYPLTVPKSDKRFRGAPVAIHPYFDLAAAFTSTKLKISKISDPKTYKSVPMKYKSGRRRVSFSKTDVLVGFVGQHYAIAGASRYCYIVNLKEAGFPLRSFVMIDGPLAHTAKIGDQFDIPLGLSNPKLNSKATFELKQAPEGAKIVNNRIVWKPSQQHLGPHSVTVAASVDGSVDEAVFDLTVTGDKLTLNFNVASMDVDRDGKYAIAWGPKILTDKNRNRDHVNNSRGPVEVALIDLENQKVVAQKAFSTGVKSAIVRKPYVFLLPMTGSVISRLDATTLEQDKRLYLKHDGSLLAPYVENQIAIFLNDHHGAEFVDMKSMKFTTPTASTDSQQARRIQQFRFGLPFDRRSNPLVEVAPGVIDMHARMLDMADGTLVRLNTNPGFQTLVNAQPPFNNSAHSHFGSGYTPKIFGRLVAIGKIRNSSFGEIANLKNTKLYPALHDPVAFGVRIGLEQPQAGGGKSVVKHYLDTVSLVDGKVLHSRIFDAVGFRSRYPNGYNNTGEKFFAGKDKVVYAKENDLFVLPIDRATVDAAPQPLYFPITRIPILGTDKPQTVSFKAKGGQGKLDYQLTTEYEGIDVDSTGTVTIDTPSLLKNYLSGKNSSSSRMRRGIQDRNATGTSSYSEYTGQPLPEGKTPFVVPIGLAVVDSEGQEDRFSAYAIVLADKAVIDQKRAQQNRQRELANASNQAGRMLESTLEQLSKTGKASKKRTQEKDNIARLDKLEKQMNRMEATIDKILEKIKN